MKPTAFFILFIFFLPFSLVVTNTHGAPSSFSHSFTGTVVEVLEGDLIKVLHKGKLLKVRLANIDCPEETQAFSEEAKKFTAMLVFSGPVRVDVKEIDFKGRAVGEVTLLDKGSNLNRELIKAGLAWWQWKQSDDVSYGDLEEIARKTKVGLWQAKNPTPPWEYRFKKDGS